MRNYPDRRLLRREDDPQKIPSIIVGDLHRYWLAKHIDGRIPSRAAIDPAEIKPLLPNVILGHVEFEPFRIFYRLVGTRIVEFRGELTGHYLDAVSWLGEEMRRATQEAYHLVIHSRRPTFAEIELRNNDDLPHRIFTGLWPLASKAEGPADMFIAVEDYGTAQSYQFGL